MSFRRKFYQTFRNKKNLIRLLIGAVILLSIPLTVILSLRRQSLLTKAAPGNANLSVQPSSKTNNVGETSFVDVFVNPDGDGAGGVAAELVSGVEVYITFNPSVSRIVRGNVTPGNFFTDHSSTVGAPVVIRGNPADGTPEAVTIDAELANGILHYAVAFPLGSGFGSTSPGNAVHINYTALASGTSNINFDSVKTIVINKDGSNVRGSLFNGIVNVASGARLYFSNPQPANPQSVNTNFKLDVFADTSSQSIDGVDARISFDKTLLNVVSMNHDTADPSFKSYPAFTFSNTEGKVVMSANIGSGTSPTPAPANGSSLKIGTVTFKPLVPATTQVTYDFAPGARNDSNMVLAGTSQTGDPQDILASVTNSDITIQGTQPTPTPSTVPSPTPSTVPSPTPTPTSTTPTPTPTLENGLNLALGKSASASTIFSADYNASKANDGNSVDTRWNSASVTNGIEWLEINFGTPTTFNRTVTKEAFDRISSYNIQYYNGSNWINVATGSTVGAAKTDTFNAVTANRVRIHINSITQFSPSIWEFEVYNAGQGTPPTSTPTPIATPTNTPVPTATPLPSATPTPSLKTVTIKLKFNGRTRQGAILPTTATVMYKKGTGAIQGPFTVNLTNGEGLLSIATGNYQIVVKAPGYLARRFGDPTNLISITSSTTSLDLTTKVLLGGDLDSNGSINSIDYTLGLLPKFLVLPVDPIADMDGSGQVNTLDYGIMRANWSLIDDQIL